MISLRAKPRMRMGWVQVVCGCYGKFFVFFYFFAISCSFPVFIAKGLPNSVICRVASKALVKTSKERKKTGIDETDEINSTFLALNVIVFEKSYILCELILTFMSLGSCADQHNLISVKKYFVAFACFHPFQLNCLQGSCYPIYMVSRFPLWNIMFSTFSLLDSLYVSWIVRCYRHGMMLYSYWVGGRKRELGWYLSFVFCGRVDCQSYCLPDIH